MKVLITGHLGFIGTYLTAEVKAAGHQVVGMDIRSDPGTGPRMDITTAPLSWADKVYHLAAKTDARSVSMASDALHNIVGSIRLFEYYGDRVVFASSCAVHYDTPYGASKRAAEHYARICGCGVVRLCNVFGYGGHSVIDHFRRAKDELSIAGDGHQVRTYAPVEDAINAFLACKPGELVILNGEDMSVNQIADGYPEKRRIKVERGKWDITDGRQHVRSKEPPIMPGSMIHCGGDYKGRWL